MRPKSVQTLANRFITKVRKDADGNLVFHDARGNAMFKVDAAHLYDMEGQPFIDDAAASEAA